jgi:hypothetical protein
VRPRCLWQESISSWQFWNRSFGISLVKNKTLVLLGLNFKRQSFDHSSSFLRSWFITFCILLMFGIIYTDGYWYIWKYGWMYKTWWERDHRSQYNISLVMIISIMLFRFDRSIRFFKSLPWNKICSHQIKIRSCEIEFVLTKIFIRKIYYFLLFTYENVINFMKFSNSIIFIGKH